MYKNMRNFLIVIAIISITIISALIYLVNIFMFKEFRNEYRLIKEEQIEYFFNENYKDLEVLINSHAAWTETLEAINSGDFDWLYENATGYIIDDTNLNIDYIFVMDESGKYQESYGDFQVENLKTLSLFKAALDHNEGGREFIWHNGEPLLLVASPIMDNEKGNPSGCYILGRKFSDSELSSLKKLLSNKYVYDLKFSDQIIEDTKLSYDSVTSNFLLDYENKVILISTLSINFFGTTYNLSMATILLIIMLVGTLAVIVLNINLKKLSIKLVQVIEMINLISNGKYHFKVDMKKSTLMPEVNQLVESINHMSSDIVKHISEVKENMYVIDQQYIDMIELLADTVEMNDSYTYHHSVSVAKYALMIGTAIGFEQLKDLELAAQLHDVGKISIAKQILNKPGKLTPEEFEVIKSHSFNGYKLLSKIEKFDVAKYGVLYHHEKYNGTGYPEGLEGNEIPMIAQIITVADIYDALTSDRAYRKAVTSDEAMAILFEEKGKSLNPLLVDVFHKEMEKINEVVYQNVN